MNPGDKFWWESETKADRQTERWIQCRKPAYEYIPQLAVKLPSPIIYRVYVFESLFCNR